jgi:hypothetical protein
MGAVGSDRDSSWLWAGLSQLPPRRAAGTPNPTCCAAGERRPIHGRLQCAAPRGPLRRLALAGFKLRAETKLAS